MSFAFSGSITALITPFQEGKIDEVAFQAICEGQIAAGTSALVPCGTTGESPTLTHEEHHRVVSLAIEAAAGRVPILAGAGSNSTAEAIDLTAHAKKAGAAAALIVTPYYNKPTQEGLYAHYHAIHDAVDLPIIIYNIPGRSVIDMRVETMARLAEAAEHRRREGRHRQSGTPAANAPCLWARFYPAVGRGCHGPRLSGAGRPWLHLRHVEHCAVPNAPQLHAAWAIAAIWSEMGRLRDLLMPVHHAMFVETSPAPGEIRRQPAGHL